MAGVKFQKKFTLAKSVGSIFITRKNLGSDLHFRAPKFRMKISQQKFLTVKSHILFTVNSRHVIKE